MNEIKEQEYCVIRNEYERIIIVIAGIEKNEDSINKAINEIWFISNKLEMNKIEHYVSGLRNIIKCLTLKAVSALMRMETREIHCRTDFSNKGNNMFGNFIYQRNGGTIFIKKKRVK